jgi:hypothetical protein
MKRLLTALTLAGLLACTVRTTDSSSGSGTSGSATNSDAGATGDGGGAGACPAQAIPPAVSGACVPRFVTPSACEVVDLSGGKTYELAWTTGGTGCETPWKLCAAGNPVSDPNSTCVDLNVDVNAGISRTGGVYRINATSLAGLSSDNGYYHVLVTSFFGSHNGTVAFYVKK